MPYILFFIGTAVFSVCQNLLMSSLISLKKPILLKSSGIVFAISPLLLCAYFSAERYFDAAFYIPPASASFVSGFIIPLIMIAESDRIFTAEETLKFILISASACLVAILSQFRFTMFSSALCILFYAAYCVFTFSAKSDMQKTERCFRFITAVFSILGIAAGCKISAENAVLMSISSEMPHKYTVLCLIAVYAFLTKIYSKKHIGISSLCDFAESMILLGYPSCRILSGSALHISESTAKTDIPFFLMLSVLLAVTAKLRRKNMWLPGIALFITYIFYISATVIAKIHL